MPKNNMSIGYVILESAPIEVPEAKVISEAGKRVIGEGIIQTAEEENRNGRCYLHQDLLREIQCPRTKELLSTGNMLSENGHPMDTSMMRQQTIEPNNTVARFLKIWMDGNNVMAHFKGTNNSKGEEFDQDLREGVLPSWSLRALGSLTNKGGRNIVENLRVITWDRVIFPSHPHAYTTRLVTESAALESGKIERINNNGMLIPITNDSVLSYIKNESANIRSLISQIDFMYESAKLVNPNQVQLVAKTGDIFVVNLEHHISNEIQNFCLNAGSILY
jgi:hypothetical protein